MCATVGILTIWLRPTKTSRQTYDFIGKLGSVALKIGEEGFSWCHLDYSVLLSYLAPSLSFIRLAFHHYDFLECKCVSIMMLANDHLLPPRRNVVYAE